MKALSFILVLSALSLMATAQKLEPNTNTTTDKRGLTPEKTTPTNPFSKPAIDSTLKKDSIQSRVGRRTILDSLPSARRSYSMPQNNNIGRIPNALPAYETPEFAAMPNAAGSGRRAVIRAVPSSQD